MKIIILYNCSPLHGKLFIFLKWEAHQDLEEMPLMPCLHPLSPWHSCDCWPMVSNWKPLVLFAQGLSLAATEVSYEQPPDRQELVDKYPSSLKSGRCVFHITWQSSPVGLSCLCPQQSPAQKRAVSASFLFQTQFLFIPQWFLGSLFKQTTCSHIIVSASLGGTHSKIRGTWT